MSKIGRRENDRQRALAAARAQQQRERRRRTALIVGASVLGAGAVSALVWTALTGTTNSPTSTASGSPSALTGLQTYTDLSSDHVTGPVDYPQTPPVGGAHSAIWQNCGIYDTPVPNEDAVHSLEHGAMWITYQSDLPADQVAILRADVAGQPYALLSPYPDLPAPVVATVWGAQLPLTSATDPQLQVFIDTYTSGQHAPEPGGECAGGNGTPTG